MADEATTTPVVSAEGAPATPTPDAGPEAPPWGDDFDAARAWKTIQTQRASESDLQKRLSAFEKAEQEKADAEKTETQKMADALAAAQGEAVAARRELLVSKAAVKHSLPESVLSLITGQTAEEVEAQASALAEFGSGAAKPPATQETPPGKPKPALVPGQGAPEGPAAVDTNALAAAIRTRRF